MNDFDEIYRLYTNDVYRYLLKFTGNETEAEELTQETFLHAIEKIHTFRGETSIKAWLIVIAKNCYYSAMRSPWKYPTELAENMQSDHADANLYDCFADRESAKRIHRVLHDMNEPYKEVFGYSESCRSKKSLNCLVKQKAGQKLPSIERKTRF